MLSYWFALKHEFVAHTLHTVFFFTITAPQNYVHFEKKIFGPFVHHFYLCAAHSPRTQMRGAVGLATALPPRLPLQTRTGMAASYGVI
jgi:hypothetical protein